jgi:hypothetical protein
MRQHDISLLHLVPFIELEARKAKTTPRDETEQLEELETRIRGYLNYAVALRPSDPLLLALAINRFEDLEDEYKKWLLHFAEQVILRINQLAESSAVANVPAGGIPKQHQEPTLNSPTNVIRPASEQVFPAGTPLDAYKAIRDILRPAQRSLFIVDSYVDPDIIEILGTVRPTVAIRVLTEHIYGDFRGLAKRFNQQRSGSPSHRNLEVRTSNTVHDRYLVIDGTKVFHLGMSIKDFSRKLSRLAEHSDPSVKEVILKTLEDYWTKAQIVEL